MEKILFIDPEKCTGCRLCEIVCSIKHEKAANPTLSRIHVAKWENSGLYVPVVCVQCESPICEQVCPVKAIKRDEKTGAVLINSEVCVGCRLCALYCPFAGAQIDSKKGRVLKCDLCNGEPVCAKFCDPQALQYVKASKANMMKQRAAAEKFSEFMKKQRAMP